MKRSRAREMDCVQLSVCEKAGWLFQVMSIPRGSWNYEIEKPMIHFVLVGVILSAHFILF
ncbi:rCG37677 [Rattus norvegicus]|uniref:RCG37677 n=1 Tax=Rattus norvegicus TaxID=10116 RepID=A6JEY8_RAT|nr:rCG37677 [Rattus norvegicus]